MSLSKDRCTDDGNLKEFAVIRLHVRRENLATSWLHRRSREIGHEAEEDPVATKLGLDKLDVSAKVRPAKPKPGRYMNLWVERKWPTIGSESPECRSQAVLNTRVSSTVIRMFWRRCSAHVDTRYSRWNRPVDSNSRRARTGARVGCTHVHESVRFLMEGSGKAALGVKP
jgi:hypothetical protein